MRLRPKWGSLSAPTQSSSKPARKPPLRQGLIQDMGPRGFAVSHTTPTQEGYCENEKGIVTSLSSEPGTQQVHRYQQYPAGIAVSGVIIWTLSSLSLEICPGRTSGVLFPSTRRFTSWSSFRFGDIQDPWTSNCSEMTPLGKSLKKCSFPLFFPHGKPYLKIIK